MVFSYDFRLILGYAYLAFECFKTFEKRSAANAELRFSCQYWVIIAVLTAFERICDISVSLYGTRYVYNAMLRPFVARHETDIELSLREMRAKAWDVTIYYWHNSSELGQTRFFEIIHYLTSKPSRPRSEVPFFPLSLKFRSFVVSVRLHATRINRKIVIIINETNGFFIK
ncbi:hypothetical protein Hdeb2414_s0031g00709571 [Helianthus debilis subsp. tardiflorus]